MKLGYVVQQAEPGAEGDKGAGAVPPVPAKPDANGGAKGFTQEDINRIVAGERKKFESVIEKTQTEHKQLADEFGKWKELIESIAGEDPANAPQTQISDSDPFKELEKELIPPPGVKDTQLWREVAKRQYVQRSTITQLLDSQKKQQDMIEKLTQQSTQEQELRKQAEARAVSASKDVEISKVLSANRCIDNNMALLFFGNKVIPDPNGGGRFVYRLDNGEVTTLEKGIAENLPKYLIEPLADTGGSGASGGRGIPTDQELTSAEADLKATFERAQRSGRQSDVLAFQQKEKAFKALKAAKEAKK